MKRAYSILEVKAFDDAGGKRTFRGIASTPSVDRMGDVVEPKGMTIKLPAPLLWQHNSREPIGWVTVAKATAEGIEVECEVASVAEEGKLKERLDDAWQTLKAKLVRGLSIGFDPIESAHIDGTYGYRFLKWEMLELSCVTIPANADCSIQAIKSIDQQLLAASGVRQRAVVVRLDSLPGASGQKPKTIPKEKDMRTIKEQIEALENKRAASVARREAVQAKALEEGRTKDEAEKEEFDTLTSEIDSIDAELKDLRVMERQAVSSAVAVTRQVGAEPHASALARDPNDGRQPSGVVFSRSNLEPGIRFARYAQALVRGKNNPQMALACIQADRRWMKETPELELVMKAAVAAGDTTTSGWASELVYAQNLANEFIEYLRPMTILGKIPNLRRVPFNMRVGGLSGGSTGYWVGQGAAIPVSKGTSTSVSLAIAKAAGIVAIDNELARLSTPSAELMIRNDLAKAISFLLDDSFINPNNGGLTNEKPASMTYGLTPVTPTGTTYATLRADLQTLMETALDAYLDTSGSVWIMSASLALKLSMMVNALDQLVSPRLSINGGEFQGMPAIVSQAAQIAGSPQYNDILIWLHPQEVFMADDGQITVEASREASIELLDNPTNLSTGATAATSVVSMYQTESMAIKAVRYVNWTKRRSTACQFIQNAAYV